MMGLKLHLRQMIVRGVKSLYYDFDGKPKNLFPIILWFVIVPLAVGGFCYYKQWQFPDGAIDTLLSILGIFTALIFGVLFIAPDKFSKRVEMLKEQKNDAIQNYLIRYENFAKSFVEQITLIIICSIVLIGNLFAILLFNKMVLHSLAAVLLCIFGQLFFVLLSNVYMLMKEDIHISNKQKGTLR